MKSLFPKGSHQTVCNRVEIFYGVLDNIPFRNVVSRSSMSAWQIEPLEQFSSDSAFYTRKHPRELEAILNNLKRFIAQLNSCKNSRCVQAGYIHTEGKGVLALDQKGGGAALQETRLYLYADDQNRILYLITIGNKSGQSADIQLAHRFVDSLNHP